MTAIEELLKTFKAQQHDFLSSFFKATRADHAMCCAHLLRELTGIFENHPEQTWAQELYLELLSMYRAADYYNQHPEIDSRQHYMECLKRNYDQILEKGTAQNPLPEKMPGKRGRAKRGKIRALTRLDFICTQLKHFQALQPHFLSFRDILF